ncbi:MAG TPA: bifunctional DNA-formamidopyrimidine glycosylase/DNA-(apurinic or apyrimidinic site) lyase [Terriglobales bacterium]|nr:bifunctional DNA-formamidopyrimidine glycosylase/DNA-(apurinic or apyrimidinic site) lyase [Terriglobales bacterium]
MPELPEVETVVRGLRAALAGAVVAGARERFRGLVRGERGLLRRLGGLRVGAIERAGKFILVELGPPPARASGADPSSALGAPAAGRSQRGGHSCPPDSDPGAGQAAERGGHSRPPISGSRPGHARKDALAAPPGESRDPRVLLLLHLGMSGKLLLVPAAAPLAPHTHFVLRLAGGRELRFSDPRRFGRVALGRPGGAADPRRQIVPGREPLDIGAAEFARLFHGRAAAIKSLLLNQALLRGLGNIYADESLFRAGIAPRARHLSRARLERLRRAIRGVLQEAIAAGGSSIADYVASDGARGWFQTRHRVYGRAGRPCPRCGAPIRRIVLAGRGTHFCPRCQR